MKLKNINIILNKFTQFYKKLLKPWLKENRPLGEWFDRLYIVLDNEDKQGRTIHRSWYQTAEGLKEESTIGEQPIYKVRVLVLPTVIKSHIRYQPEISETTVARGIFPETVPELETRKLELSLGTKSTKNNWLPILFEDTYLKPERFRKQEIRFLDGKILNQEEVELVKSVYDAALNKLMRSTSK